MIAYLLFRGKQRKRTSLEIGKFGTFVPAFYATWNHHEKPNELGIFVHPSEHRHPHASST